MNTAAKLNELYEVCRVYLNEPDSAPQHEALRAMARIVGELEKAKLHQIPEYDGYQEKMPNTNPPDFKEVW